MRITKPGKYHRWEKRIRGERLRGPAIYPTQKAALEAGIAAVEEFLKNGRSPYLPKSHPLYIPLNPILSDSALPPGKPFEDMKTMIEQRVEWLTTHRGHAHAVKTTSLLKSLARLRPAWMALPPESITPEMAEGFQIDLSKKLLSAKKTNFTANKVVNALMTCWNYPWGKRRGRKVYENPWAVLDILPHARKAIRLPVPAQVELVLSKMNEAEGRLYLQMMARTGARPGEARESRWEDVLFHEGKIIYWTAKKVGGFRTPRKVPLPEDLLADLKFWRELNDRAIYVFQQEGKKEPGPRVHSWARKIQTRACKLAGLEYFHPHVYRHYYTSKLLSESTPLATIQALLGHEDFATTAKYIHQLSGVGFLEKGKEVDSKLTHNDANFDG